MEIRFNPTKFSYSLEKLYDAIVMHYLGLTDEQNDYNTPSEYDIAAMERNARESGASIEDIAAVWDLAKKHVGTAVKARGVEALESLALSAREMIQKRANPKRNAMRTKRNGFWHDLKEAWHKGEEKESHHFEEPEKQLAYREVLDVNGETFNFFTNFCEVVDGGHTKLIPDAEEYDDYIRFGGEVSNILPNKIIVQRDGTLKAILLNGDEILGDGLSDIARACQILGVFHGENDPKASAGNAAVLIALSVLRRYMGFDPDGASNDWKTSWKAFWAEAEETARVFHFENNPMVPFVMWGDREYSTSKMMAMVKEALMALAERALPEMDFDREPKAKIAAMPEPDVSVERTIDAGEVSVGILNKLDEVCSMRRAASTRSNPRKRVVRRTRKNPGRFLFGAVKGTKALGVRMHQWHDGMDAVYGVGSFFYDGSAVPVDRAEDALRLLRSNLSWAEGKDLAHLKTTIKQLEAAIARAKGVKANPRKRPAKRRAAKKNPTRKTARRRSSKR